MTEPIEEAAAAYCRQRSEDVFDLYDDRVSLREAIYYARDRFAQTRRSLLTRLVERGNDHSSPEDRFGSINRLVVDASSLTLR